MADTPTRAADLPGGSVVGNLAVVFLREDKFATDPWQGTDGSMHSDAWVDEALAAGAQVLRVGDGAGQP